MKKFLSLIMAISLTFALSTCTFPEPSPVPDYLSAIVESVLVGDVSGGHRAEISRNAYIKSSGSSDVIISYNDLDMLSRLIYSIAGSYWCDNDFRLCVGEVVLNRIASAEFPHNMSAVIMSDAQYSEAYLAALDTLPSRDCVNAALQLLLGKRMLDKCVVYQSSVSNKYLYSRFCNRLFGYTYFCTSPNLSLYTQPPSSPGAQADAAALETAQDLSATGLEFGASQQPDLLGAHLLKKSDSKV